MRSVSVHVSSWCWEHSRAKGTDRLVLVSIADMANDDGQDAYPSYVTLAKRCGGMSTKTIQRSVQRLVQLGELAVDHHGGPAREGKTNQHPNRYSFPAYRAYRKRGHLVLASGEPGSEARTSASESGDILAGSGDTAVSPYPSIDPSSSDPSLGRGERADDAGDFTLSEPSTATPKPKPSRSKPATPAPDNFDLPPALHGWFQEQGLAKLEVDIHSETLQFLDYHRAKGSTMRDWTAAWRTWMRNAGKFAQQRTRNGNGHYNGSRNGHVPYRNPDPSEYEGQIQ